MALKKTTTTVHGIVVPDAYHRVEAVELLSKTEIAYRVRSYADVSLSAFADTAYSSQYDLNGGNPIKQAYTHLKTLEAFANAEDC